MIGIFPAVFNFNWLFLKLDRFICNQLPVLPDHWWGWGPAFTLVSLSLARRVRPLVLKPGYRLIRPLGCSCSKWV